MKDFQGFRFGQIHTKDLHLIVVSTSSRFVKNLLPANTDQSVDVPGGNGKYYFGSTFGVTEITVNIALEDIDEMMWRRLSQIFSNDKPQDLVFDENPYKTYKAKIKQKPDFKYVCFRNENTGERVYKGEGTLNFICYHPFAFCFNKYIVRAADNYTTVTPEEIIKKNFETDYDKSAERSKDIVKPQKKFLYEGIKSHFNVTENMNTPWKGGYPTIEQVQRGELFFTDPKDNQNKLLLDVRGYWDNVPLWAKAAKLLTTPTLDYDQELIFCPQYNRTHYYNMDTGLNKANFALGSRLLVYNPGDIPIDFELKLGNLTSEFRGNDDAMFRISRYNVQRLTIEQAVDWLKLKPRPDIVLQGEDEVKKWVYGTKYFGLASKKEEGRTDVQEPQIEDLRLNHPNHCYIVEPIPQEKLGHFIRLFYWQSNLLFNRDINPGILGKDEKEFYPNYSDQVINRHIIDCKMGEQYADRYEELRSQCITDDERNELYWITLREAILERYKDLGTKFHWFTDGYTYDDFEYDFIFNPLEYIRYDNTLDYGEFNFNITRFPQFMTFDYFDISNKNFNKISYGECGCDSCMKEEYHREQTLPLILDSERRMLYNNNEPEFEYTADFYNKYPEKTKNFYNYKGTKTIWNDNIVRGHWFQLPPGWSMIDISPLVDEDNWGGKRWLDARPFDWGDTDEDDDKDCYRKDRELYEDIYRQLVIKYINNYYPGDKTTIPYGGIAYDINGNEISEWNNLNDLAIESLENFIQFRRWYNGVEVNDSVDLYHLKYTDIRKDMERGSSRTYNQRKLLNLFPIELLQYRRNKIELQFLKDIAEWWRFNKPDGNDIDDWWWWANHYIWNNFPPIYWGYADLLNKAEIKYIPQYY